MITETDLIGTHATLIEPVGDLTLELSRRLCEAVSEAKRYGGIIVISLAHIAQVSWAALNTLAEHIAFERRDGTEVRFSDMVPRLRSLMRELGLTRGCFTRFSRVSARRHIVLPA